jgi:hypothetical protein
MSITINFRVLGIFFRVDNFQVMKASPTIKDVMDEIVARKPTGEVFEYSASTDGTLEIAKVIKTAPFKSPNKSEIEYPAGTYLIKDNLYANPYQTWQWYLIRDNKTVNKDNKFTSFGKSTSDYPLQDGDSIIWRCVSIVASPYDPIGVPKPAAGVRKTLRPSSAA